MISKESTYWAEAEAELGINAAVAVLATGSARIIPAPGVMPDVMPPIVILFSLSKRSSHFRWRHPDAGTGAFQGEVVIGVSRGPTDHRERHAGGAVLKFPSNCEVTLYWLIWKVPPSLWAALLRLLRLPMSTSRSA